VRFIERKIAMYEIAVHSHFSGAHRLRYLHGKCEELHGHNWRVEASLLSNRLGKEEVVIDFGILKQTKSGYLHLSIDTLME
jgi:6-pyruvoyltetrahydropterin/6-carboxytetrahydropterin synthase